MSTERFLRIIVAYPENPNAHKNAIKFPNAVPKAKPSTIIINIPNAATIIAKNVSFFIRSVRKNQASVAVRKGIELSVKRVTATVVFVIACKKAIPAKANRKAANTPNHPMPTN